MSLTQKESILLENIRLLEKRNNDFGFENDRMSQKNTNFKYNIDFLQKEIEAKQKEVMKKIKLLSKYNDSRKDKKDNNQLNDIGFLNIEQDIKTKLLELQKNYNLNINSKLEGDVEKLVNFQISLKVNYIIIKKIDIREDFLKAYKVVVGSELEYF